MAQSKKNITPDNITEWLASTGFLFPRNEIELERFNKLYEDVEMNIPMPNLDKIINYDILESKVIKMPESLTSKNIEEYRMVARNGNNLPSHILYKIKKNQSKNNEDTSK